VTRLKSSRRLLFVLAILATVAIGGVLVSAETLRLTRNVPGDSKPIILHADNITTWVDGNRRVILLQGVVLAEQAVVQVRTQNAVAWVDQDQTRKTGILHVDLYAEGDVRLENGPDNQFADKALLELNTRGELKLKSQRGKVDQEARPNDPVYRRALEELKAKRAAPASPIQRTSLQTPAAPEGGSPPPGPGAPGFAPLPPAAPPGVVPPASGPAPRSPFGNPPPAPGAPVPGAPPPTAPGAPPVPPAAPTPVPPAIAPPPASNQSSTDEPLPTTPVAAAAPPRNIRIVPRTDAFQVQEVPLTSGERAIVVTGGVMITIATVSPTIDLLDVEADRLVIWTKGDTQRMFNQMRGGGHNASQAEFYMAGNVVLREKEPKDAHTLHADELYYDIGRNIAVAYQGDLEFKQPGFPDPIHMQGDEILQVSPTKFESFHTRLFSSRLPSDPGLLLDVRTTTLETRTVPKKSWWGLGPVEKDDNGQPITQPQRIFTGENAFVEVADVPVFWLPFVQGDPENPFGPLRAIHLGFSQMFGARIGADFNLYDLFGLQPQPGTRWHGTIDELTYRGPAIGTTYDYGGVGLFGIPGLYTGTVSAWGIHDVGQDLLGGNRGALLNHPEWRGRLLARHQQELGDDWFLQTQLSALSDKNFLEQYYWNEFNTDINQETFIYLKNQRDNWAVTGLLEPRIRNWVNETQHLPELRGYLLGQSFFDIFTYNARAVAGYDQFLQSHVGPPNTGLTSFSTTTGRFDLYQEIYAPFYLGPVKVMPYGVVDMTAYTNDLYGQSRGRPYVGGGVRASLPLSRLYPEVQSEMFNLNGINHKMVLSANYYAAWTDSHFWLFPQLDRLNDDASDQSVRDMANLQQMTNPFAPTNINNNLLYDPQVYAIRNLMVLDSLNYLEEQDTIQALQLDWKQRLQTKRGYPGMQHIVDWMTLDTAMTYFPMGSTNNFGSPVALMTYDYVWNVGDRTAIVSNGWLDPMPNGARWYTVGTFLNRPDRTSFYVGYRQTEPVGVPGTLDSKLMAASASYIISPKYAVTTNLSYDFALKSGLNNGITFTRMGADAMVQVGLGYNSLLNNFNFTFLILPNIALGANRMGPLSAGMFGNMSPGR
jgi:hypothetical protein